MHNQISPKLAALAVALMMNGLIIGGVAYIFNTQAHGTATLTFAHAGGTVKPAV